MHFLSKCPYCFLYLSESCPTAVNLYPLSWISFLSGKLFVSLSLSLTFALTSSGSFGFRLSPPYGNPLSWISSRLSHSASFRKNLSVFPSFRLTFSSSNSPASLDFVLRKFASWILLSLARVAHSAFRLQFAYRLTSSGFILSSHKTILNRFVRQSASFPPFRKIR